jgi:hypothetical protein
MFDIEIGRERRAENATALRMSWPPPSRTLPSMSVVSELAEAAICAGRNWDSVSALSLFRCDVAFKIFLKLFVQILTAVAVSSLSGVMRDTCSADGCVMMTRS